MSAATATLEKNAPLPNSDKKFKISWEAFLNEYSRREDGYKYEYVDGTVIKSHSTMTELQAHIAHNLNVLFYTLFIAGKIKGSFQTEMDAHLSKSKFRRPDMCYLTEAQSLQAVKGAHPFPEFIVEIVSPNDTMEYYDHKLDNYFNAGAKVIWLVYPQSERVQIYQEDKTSIICSENMICSAAPVLPAFALPATDIFKKTFG